VELTFFVEILLEIAQDALLFKVTQAEFHVHVEDSWLEVLAFLRPFLAFSLLDTCHKNFVEDLVLVMVLRSTKNVVKVLVCEVTFGVIRFCFHQQWM